MAIDIYGSKFNNSSPSILYNLGRIKNWFNEIDEALRFFAEAREIQEVIFTKNSPFYHTILEKEEQAKEAQRILNEKSRKTGIKYRILGSLTLIGILSVSAFYLLRSKQK